MQIQSERPDVFSSLQSLSMKGADVNSPATHGRTNSVISACGKCSRTAFIAGIASTASPTQFGPRIRIFSGCIASAKLCFAPGSGARKLARGTRFLRTLESGQRNDRTPNGVRGILDTLSGCDAHAVYDF